MGFCFTSLTFVPSSMTQGAARAGLHLQAGRVAAEGAGSHQQCPHSQGTVPPHVNSVDRARCQLEWSINSPKEDEVVNLVQVHPLSPAVGDDARDRTGDKLPAVEV